MNKKLENFNELKEYMDENKTLKIPFINLEKREIGFIDRIKNFFNRSLKLFYKIILLAALVFKIQYYGKRNDEISLKIKQVYIENSYDTKLFNSEFDITKKMLVSGLNIDKVMESFLNVRLGGLAADVFGNEVNNINIENMKNNFKISERIEILKIMFNINCFLLDPILLFDTLKKYKICNIINVPRKIIEFRNLVLSQVKNITINNVYLITDLYSKEIIEIKRLFIIWMIFIEENIKNDVFDIMISGDEEIFDLLFIIS